MASTGVIIWGGQISFPVSSGKNAVVGRGEAQKVTVQTDQYLVAALCTT